MKKVSIHDFLVNNGDHVWYYWLTDELLICRVKPDAKRTHNVSIAFGDGDEIQLGPITYLGKL